MEFCVCNHVGVLRLVKLQAKACNFRKSNIPPQMFFTLFCSNWYHLHNLKNVKNTHGGVLLLVKLQVLDCNFTKSKTLSWVIFMFLNCTNGTKLRNTCLYQFFPSLILQIYIYILSHIIMVMLCHALKVTSATKLFFAIKQLSIGN